MIDLHSHLLPNVDDGAQSLAVALAMLDEYVRMGFSTVVATPHWVYPTNEEHQSLIQSTYEELVQHADSVNVRLLLGRECMLPPDPAVLYDDQRLSINDSRFLLVEVPFRSRPLYLEQTIFGLQVAGKVVILAHPERYQFIQHDSGAARTLVEQGVLLQINIGSIKGTFGKAAQKAAKDLLLQGLVHLAATDSHSNGGRMQSVSSGLELLRELVGEHECRRLIDHNPELILAGDVPTAVGPPQKRRYSPKRWFGRVISLV